MRLEKLDLNLLVALESLFETQSVSETANILNLSQPTISAALKRLREYFKDDLLIQDGRTMVPTAKGRELAPAVSDILNETRLKIIQSEPFAPKTSNRNFRISASDYVYDILLAHVIKRASLTAPLVHFEILPISHDALNQFEKGKIDLLITVEQFMVKGQPSRILFKDEDILICWNKGKYAKGFSKSKFDVADFATVRFGDEQRVSVSDQHFNALGLDRNISVQLASFSALPASVVETDRVAIMHRRHAEFFSTKYPISLLKLPVENPGICQIAQWHKFRENDTGIQWLLGELHAFAEELFGKDN